MHSFVSPNGSADPGVAVPAMDSTMRRARNMSGASTHAGASAASTQRTMKNINAYSPEPSSPYEPSSGRPSLDNPSHSRPSLSRSHNRQISVTPQIPSLYRQGSSGSLHTPATPQTAVPQTPRATPQNGSHIERKPSLVSLSSHTQSPPGANSRLQSIRERTENGPLAPRPVPASNQGIVSINEFGLEHLFESFKQQAHVKINVCVVSAEREFHSRLKIDHECAEGVDATFDMVISGLGTIVKDQPKSLISRLLTWRSEYVASQEHSDAPAGDGASHTHSTSVASSAPSRAPSRADTMIGSPATGSGSAPPADLETRRKEMRNSAATYLIGRVMISVLSQTTLAALTIEVARRLEGIIFEGQIKQVSPDEIYHSGAKRAKWLIMTKLLGVFSELDLEGISKAFFAEIQHLQNQLGPKTNTDRGAEEILALRLRGMHYFRLRTDTPEAWHRSRDFMASLTKLFGETHGLPPKKEYCRLLESILLPLAEHTKADFSDGLWRNIVNKLQERLLQLSRKPKYWSFAFPAQVVLACVSAPDLFAAKWSQLLPIPSLSSKLPKVDTVERSLLLKCLCRMTWSYLQRNIDFGLSMPVKDSPVFKNVEDIARGVFFCSKRYPMSTDPSISEPLIVLIRIIGFAFPEFAFKSIVFPLLNAEALLYNKELKLDTVDPDRVALGIRAFLALIGDLERAQPPVFPLDFADEYMTSGGRRVSFQVQPAAAPLQKRKGSVPKVDRLSQPVLTNNFTETTRLYYDKFCEVLGIITQMCNGAFGGQAVLDEKFAVSDQKTPLQLAVSLAKREPTSTGADLKGTFYDLFHVAVQALPRCRPRHIPMPALVNLLCIGTAHVELNIANSSRESLRALSRQGHAQLIAEKFGSFILNYDNRYSTMSDGGLLGQRHIENTLKLYIELLNIWVDELREKVRIATIEKAGDNLPLHRQALLDTSGVWSQVDRLESQGLFFLCSPMPSVRGYAVQVLELVTDLETALGEHNDRIWLVLRGGYNGITIKGDPELSPVEMARLAKKSLPQLCCSHDEADKSLWAKLFPCVIRTVFDKTPMAVTPTREDICARLYSLQTNVEAAADDDRPYHLATPISFDSDSTRSGSVESRKGNIEQWRFFLMFACTTLNKTESVVESIKSPVSETSKRVRGNSLSNGNMSATSTTSNHSFGPGPGMMRRTKTVAVGDESLDVGNESGHARTSSSSSQAAPPESLNNATDLFQKISPLLFAKNKQMRAAAVSGLSAINIHLYKALLDALDRLARTKEDEARKAAGPHVRTGSTPRKPDGHFLFATEVVQVYQITASRFMPYISPGSDEQILEHLSVYTKELAMWLQRGENSLCETDLKVQFSGLIEAFYSGIADRLDAMRLMPFQTRKASYVLLDRWWREASQSIDEARKAHNVPAGVAIPLPRNDANVTKAKELSSLRIAACKAMAALCAGPAKITIQGVSVSAHSFNIQLLLDWIVQMLEQTTERQVETGRKALRNLLSHNKHNEDLLDQALDRLFRLDKTKSLAEFTDVLVEVFIAGRSTLNIPYWRILSVLMLVLGKTQRSVRMAAVRLLRAYEGRESHTSQLHQLEISVSDNTTTVYKMAQFEISRRLSDRHPELIFYVFSDLVKAFVNLESDQQRNLVPVLLPWLQRIELTLEDNGNPNAETYMVLTNLLFITKRCFAVFHTEIQALWQALVTGPYENNLKLVLDYLFELGTGRQYGNWPGCAKQVVVFLATSTTRQGDLLVPNTGKVIEMIMSKLSPKAMISYDNSRNTIIPPPDVSNYPYVANLLEIYDTKVGQASMSLGQTCLIFAVDLIVSPVQLAPERIPGLLQILMILWDHHADIVREHAREMLVHLIHELVLSKLDNNQMEQHIPPLEQLIDQVRSNDKAIAWHYDERSDQRSGHELPTAMPGLVNNVIKFFSLVYQDIDVAWGTAAMEWATQCPVRHLACRSLQVYRCILQPRDFKTLVEFTSRLSATIADEKNDIQAYSMELIRTVRSMVEAECRPESRLMPALFWTTYFGLESTIEWEFKESLAILEFFLAHLDFSSTRLTNLLNDARPGDFSLDSGSVTDLVYKGCRSRDTYEDTVRVLDYLVQVPSNAVIGDNSRILFCFLAHYPRLLRHFHDLIKPDRIALTCANLASAARGHDQTNLAAILEDYMKGSFRDAEEFIRESVLRITELPYFHAMELDVLKFVMGMLNNNMAWIKAENLRLLRHLMPHIDMRKPEIANQGPDLVSPLLRLLQTEHCPEALKVLDNVMPLKGTPLGQKHLEMSMAGSRSSQALRREFEATQSFYGIPEASGWSVAMPATIKEKARRNLEKLKDFGAAPIIGDTHTPTPEIRFYQDSYAQASYFPEVETNGGGHTEHGHQSSNSSFSLPILGNNLEMLDDFFSEPSSAVSSSSNSFGQSLSQTTAPSSRQLSHDLSGTPYKQSGSRSEFPELRTTPPRDTDLRSPGLYSSFSASPVHSLPSRPTLQGRAMTSPAVQQIPEEDPMTAHTPSELDMLSEDDTVAGRNSTSERPFVAETATSRSRSGSKSSIRSGVRSLSRRLTASGRRAAHMESSPEVPKVPDRFFQNQPQSNEL